MEFNGVLTLSRANTTTVFTKRFTSPVEPRTGLRVEDTLGDLQVEEVRVKKGGYLEVTLSFVEESTRLLTTDLENSGWSRRPEGSGK